VLIAAGIALLRERRSLRVPIPSSAAVLVVIALLALPLVACSGGGSASACQPSHSEPLNPALNHVLAGAAEPSYTTDPPTSGPYTPGAALHGVLTQPLSRPVQVGALEAGEVLLQYRDLSADELKQLSQLASDKVVVVPNPSLPDRVVATAWLFKQTCSGVDAEALHGFIRTRAGHGPGTDG